MIIRPAALCRRGYSWNIAMSLVFVSILILGASHAIASDDGTDDLLEGHSSPDVTMHLDNDTLTQNRPAYLTIEFRNVGEDEIYLIEPTATDVALTANSDLLHLVDVKNRPGAYGGGTQAVLEVNASDSRSFAFPVYEFFDVSESGEVKIAYSFSLKKKVAGKNRSKFEQKHYTGWFTLEIEPMENYDVASRRLASLSNRIETKGTRQNALDELLFFDNPQAAEMMVDAAAMTDLNFESRRAVVNRLALLPEKVAVKHLVEVVSENEDNKLSVYVLQVLSRSFGESGDTGSHVEDILVGYLRHANDDLRLVAMQEIVGIYGKRVIPDIRHLIDDDSSEVRRTAIALIGQYQDIETGTDAEND